MDEDALRRALEAVGVSAPVRWDDVTTSTNETAARLASEGTPAWTLVAAGHQTRGRGRAGRSWLDRSGRALLLSVVLRPVLGAEHLGLVSLATGTAMADAIAQVSGLDVRCKWPNDLLVDGAKVGGILAESELDGDAVRHVVVGVGVNLEPPDGVEGAAGIGDVDEETLLTAFLRRLASLITGEPDEILDSWRARADTLGRRVEATTVDGTVIRGVATDIDPTGALSLDVKGRGTERIAFGDVRHLMPIEGGPSLRETFRGGGMFDRFTADSRTVVAQADRVRTELGHARIGPGHLLIALAETGPNPATRALEEGRFTAARARDDLARLVQEAASDPAGSTLARPRGKVGRHLLGRLDASTKKVFERSLRLALRDGHDRIGVEHILLATLDRSDTEAASLLVSQQVPLDQVRAAVERELPPSRRRLRRQDPSR